MVGERGRRLDDVLAVVQDHHLVPVPKRGGQPVKRTRAGPGGPAGDDRLADAQRVEYRVRHLGRVGHRRQWHEPRGHVEPPRGFGRQPRLAHSPRTGERDQPGGAQVLQHPGHVLVAADETGQGAVHPDG